MLFPLAICCKNYSKKQIVNEEQHVPVLLKKKKKKGDSAHILVVTGEAQDCAKKGTKPKIDPGLNKHVVMPVGQAA